jgi:hypothetical protein
VADVSKLLYQSVEERSPCFLGELDPRQHEDHTLRNARKDIRNQLRAKFTNADPRRFGEIVKPRFYTQGSFAYKTLNRPAYVPPQQMDMDDGCYLPLSFVKLEKRPKVAAKEFFDFVDAALMELAVQRGWKLVTDKDTCSRLIISPWAHVDIPLYAIPDDEFETLAKAAVEAALVTDGGSILLSEAASRRTAMKWEQLPDDKVLLAHRKDGWRSSDPRKIRDWFVMAVEEHGEILRRVCRYLKAWRDYHHDRVGTVTSILLMACATAVFNDHADSMPSRDDEALALVAAALPRLLSGRVANPAEPDSGEDLTSRLDQDARTTAVRLASELHQKLDSILNRCFNQHVAVEELQAIFGGRIPSRPDLVRVGAQQARAEVLSREPRIVPAPVVGTSISG